jgi:hypothetical protein
MRTIVIVMLACGVSPTLADVYKCNSGGKTIYQGEPCPNAKVIDNINGQAPSRYEQMKAMERTTREKSLAARLSGVREVESRKFTKPITTKTTQIPVSHSPVVPKPMNRPDKYYDRPDRYYDRPDKYESRKQ